MPHTGTSLRAAQAAARLARRLGIGCERPQLLHESQRISIRLYPHDIVARGVGTDDAEALRRLAREVDIARHLAANHAPVVRLDPGVAAGPHIEDGFAFTLWQFVADGAADDDNAAHVAHAAAALRRLHQALAGFDGELSDFWAKPDRCRRLLADERALPGLGAADRAFLRAGFDRLRARVAGPPADAVPIHGDAHLGNVFITHDGALWNDLEDVCRGPREWDIACLPETDVSGFEPLDRDLLAALRLMRSLCVCVWCLEQYELPHKRAAADYHLQYLKDSALARR